LNRLNAQGAPIKCATLATAWAARRLIVSSSAAGQRRGESTMESWRNRKTLILSRTDMMGLVTPAEYVSCVEQAYRMHGEGRYYMDPKGHIVLDQYPGEWEAMPSYIEEPEAAACNGCRSASATAKNSTCRRCSRS
jgi:hypothetical protein